MKTWDLRDRGNAVLVAIEHVRCMQSELASRVYQIVMGWDGGDPDPQASGAENLDSLPAEQLLESVFGTLAPVPTQEEQDQKN